MAKKFYHLSEIKLQPTTQYRFRDLSGHTFGRLTVLGFAEKRRNEAYWFAQCRCNRIVKTRSSVLVGGQSKSCGCRARERARALHTMHGMVMSPEYRAYQSARTRCTNPRSAHYNRYGGRGIKFRFESFEEFYAELGKRPSYKHSVDRIENNGHYEIGNVQWATSVQQHRNTSNNHIITMFGISKCVAEWAEITGVPAHRIYKRSHRHWCTTCIFTLPVPQQCPHS